MNKNRKQQKEDKMRRGFYIRTLENLIKLIEILLFINSVIFSKTHIYIYIYIYIYICIYICIIYLYQKLMLFILEIFYKSLSNGFDEVTII